MSSPKYTVRFLLTQLSSKLTDEIPKLKDYSHFTLCALNDHTHVTSQLFDKIAEYFNQPVNLTAETVVNLSSDEDPLYAIKLNVNDETRNFLSESFDSIMVHEMNGTKYTWKKTTDTELKCPHITLGRRPEDNELGQYLIKNGFVFTFGQLDCKRVGCFDPHLSRNI